MKRLICGIWIAGVLLIFASPGFSMGQRPQFGSELLARAEIDECYNGIGEPFKEGGDCGRYEQPKANQAYLWGLTKADDKLWFGTAANMLCLVRAYSAYKQNGRVSPYENNLWLCEYQSGQYPRTEMNRPVPEIFGDYRPPEIYTYDLASRTLTNKTDLIDNINDQLLLESTFGLRSAASFDNLVFLSGPVALGKGINMFVFNAETGGFIDAQTLSGYQNIRKWLVLDDVLYAAVADEDGGGKVLRWTGSEMAPFSFEEVGVLDGVGAEIAAHNGRIFVGTWPSRTAEESSLAGIWMSPVLPEGGLTPSHAESWEKVWQVDAYEPDPFNASIYGIGAMASFDGYLYWGTMHVHGKAALLFIDHYNIPAYQYAQTYVNSWRATTLFRGRNFTGDKDIDLLYGNKYMWVYVQTGSSSGYWTRRANKMGGIYGKYGESGFDNIYNNYTWTMAEYNGQLFVGTMDHSYLWLDWGNLQQGYMGNDYIQIPVPDFPWFYTPDEDEYGADLWRFPSAHDPAVRVSRTGLGNYTNYGFRSSVADENGLYLGTANPACIHEKYGEMRGGWELIRVYK
mgnify:CR=1 FL=1